MDNTNPELNLVFVQGLRKALTNEMQKKKFPFQAVPLRESPTLTHGWLVPGLIEADMCMWQRWRYWIECMERGDLIDKPLPQVPWMSVSEASNPADKMLKACLNAIPTHGSWKTWGGWQYFDYFLDWLLFAFGHPGQPEMPVTPLGCEGASDRLFQIFCLESLMAWPYDYWGNILADNKFGRSEGFFPTPIDVVKLMAAVLFVSKDADYRRQRVLDPCLGTGRMLLVASNWSVCLHGQDINSTVIKSSLVSGYVWVPWLVKPFPFVDRDIINPALSAEISDAMVKVGSARPDVARYLNGSAHDLDNQWMFEPIKKRRKRGEQETATFEGLFRVQAEESVEV